MHTQAFTALTIGIFLFSLSACATIDPEFADPRDPYENFNRVIHDFNEAIDQAVLQPVSEGYQTITPDPIDQGITNFFHNLDDINSLINNVLQLKIPHAMEDASRILVNSFFGLGGLFNIANDLEIPRHNEDFGQTLGYWGIDSGSYLVLPLFGPSSERDLFGRVGDFVTNPLRHAPLDNTTTNTLGAVDVIDTRASLLDASRMMREATLGGDTYSFLRDSYLQRRLNVVYDGNPPEQDDFF